MWDTIICSSGMVSTYEYSVTNLSILAITNRFWYKCIAEQNGAGKRKLLFAKRVGVDYEQETNNCQNGVSVIWTQCGR